MQLFEIFKKAGYFVQCESKWIVNFIDK
jgi:hypothetical protein